MRYVLRVYESKRDVCGNRYYLAELIDVKTRECVYWDTACESNALYELRRAMGFDDWGDLEKFRDLVWQEHTQIVGLRELRRIERKNFGVFFCNCKKAYDYLVCIVKQNLAEKEGR